MESKFGYQKTNNTNMLFLLVSDVIGYDTYDSMVVVAASEEEARQIVPSEYALESGAWSYPNNLKVECIGYTNIKCGTIIIASFNAG